MGQRMEKRMGSLLAERHIENQHLGYILHYKTCIDYFQLDFQQQNIHYIQAFHLNHKNIQHNEFR